MNEGQMSDFEVENAVTVAQERETCEPEYPCPEEIWIGPWRDVAGIVGYRDWRVWVGVTAALSARAHRNLWCRYYGPLYGMGYYLLVAASSQGKSVCTRTCRTLLPHGYEIFTSVESGQALAESLATINRDESGKIVDTTSFPAALIVSEWSMILQNMDFHGSSLLERFCEIADAEPQVDLNRASKKGEGKIRITNPTLTVCATTTLRNYQKSVTERHIASGFINRHLILPGARQRWDYNSEQEDLDFDQLAAYAFHELPQAHTFGLGQPMRFTYSPEAFRLDDAFGRPFFGEIHNGEDQTGTEDVYKRLHVYNRRIAALYAWASRSEVITVAHVQAANAVIRTSHRFLRQLHGDPLPELPAFMKANATLESLILAKVTEAKLMRKDSLCNALRRHGGYSGVSSTVEKLIQAGALRTVMQGKLKLLALPE